jgi:hypothetical protein
MLSRLIVLLVVLGLCPGAAPRTRAHAEEPRSVPQVRWDEDASAAGRRIAAAWPAALARAEAVVGARPDLAGVEVFVVRGLQRMREAARAQVPAWAAGVTVGGARVVLRADPEQGATAELEATLRHEALHLVWARVAGPLVRTVPLWFEEGLAEHVGGAATIAAGARLDVAAGTEGLLAFEQIERVWPREAPVADLAYQQSRRWIELLVERRGADAPGAVMRRTLALAREAGAEAAFDKALLDVTLHPVSDWHADWRTSLVSTSGDWWLWFFTDLGGALLAALAVVCGATFWALKRRRRRQIEALPDDPPRDLPDDAP